VHGWGEKMVALQNTPYERTLALDTDVELCEDLSHLCGFLDHYDIALARETPKENFWWEDGPDKLRNPWSAAWKLNHHNTGFILYKRTPVVLNMFHEWERTHNRKGGSDQTVLMLLLHKHEGVRHLVLPIEYNLRAHQEMGILSVTGKVYVIHGRNACIKCETANVIQEARLIVPTTLAGDMSCSVLTLERGRGLSVRSQEVARIGYGEQVAEEVERMKSIVGGHE